VTNSRLSSIGIKDIDADDAGSVFGLLHARWNPANNQSFSEYWTLGRWDGTTWIQSDARLGGSLEQIVAARGAVFASGDAWNPSTGERGLLWQWTDGRWDVVVRSVTNGIAYPPSIVESHGLVIARGAFAEIGGIKAWGLACFDGRSWRPWTDGLSLNPFYGFSNGDAAAIDGQVLTTYSGFVSGASVPLGYLMTRRGDLLSGPGVVAGPKDVRARPGQTVRLSVLSDDATSIQWQFGSTILDEGSAVGPMTFRGTRTPVLIVEGVNPIQYSNVAFSAVLSNACGQTITASARLLPAITCPADLSGRSGIADSAVELYDLLYFLDHFSASELGADMDDGSMTGVTDQTVDINDLLYFLAHFEAGC
jgi:hypothetical protein